MAYTKYYLAEWQLAKRPAINPDEDEILARRLALRALSTALDLLAVLDHAGLPLPQPREQRGGDEAGDSVTA